MLSNPPDPFTLDFMTSFFSKRRPKVAGIWIGCPRFGALRRPISAATPAPQAWPPPQSGHPVLGGSAARDKLPGGSILASGLVKEASTLAPLTRVSSSETTSSKCCNVHHFFGKEHSKIVHHFTFWLVDSPKQASACQARYGKNHS